MSESLAVHRFKTHAATAGALATALLTVGMLLAIGAYEATTNAQIAHIRAEEQEITHAERLRFSGELIVSAGRGFLITDDPQLLRRLLRARSDFDLGLKALAGGMLSAGGENLLVNIERQARDFIRIQESLVAAGNDDVVALTLRFERELIPMQQELGESLDRLVEQKEAALSGVYSKAEADRRRLRIVLYGFLAASLVLALMTTVHFARLVERAYRNEREALEAARRAIVSRDDLMGMVAHDLRTPVHAIALRAALVKKLAAAPQLREHAESITRMSHSMQHLIRTMLDVTSIQAGRFCVAPTVCSVEEIMRDAMPMLEPLGDAQGIRFMKRVQANLEVIADRERVLQVLANLVGNAIKFSPAGSHISLHVEALGDAVRFAVDDEGPGILPENLQLIFTRFWKRQPETKVGTGLGLYIAKTIIDAHGGCIWAESEAGHGATFYFTLQRSSIDKTSASRSAPFFDSKNPSTRSG